MICYCIAALLPESLRPDAYPADLGNTAASRLNYKFFRNDSCWVGGIYAGLKCGKDEIS